MQVRDEEGEEYRSIHGDPFLVHYRGKVIICILPDKCCCGAGLECAHQHEVLDRFCVSMHSINHKEEDNYMDDTLTSWQLVFSQSKANNGDYSGDVLPHCPWKWPEGTWFQRRLKEVRKESI